MIWRRTVVAPDGRCHLLDGEPVYPQRFDEVLAFHAPGLAAVRRGDEAWHIDVEGHPAYAGRFLRTFGFYDDRAAVCGAEGWHHILPDGVAVYAERHAWCGNYQEGRCPVRGFDGQYRHMELDGRAVGSKSWRYAGDYRQGYAVVQGDEGLSTHVDARGEFLHDRWFLDLDVFHKGFARARDESGWMHIDKTGGPVYEERFAMVEAFYNGYARVERYDGALIVIDEGGQHITDLRSGKKAEECG